MCGKVRSCPSRGCDEALMSPWKPLTWTTLGPLYVWKRKETNPVLKYSIMSNIFYVMYFFAAPSSRHTNCVCVCKKRWKKNKSTRLHLFYNTMNKVAHIAVKILWYIHCKKKTHDNSFSFERWGKKNTKKWVVENILTI